MKLAAPPVITEPLGDLLLQFTKAEEVASAGWSVSLVSRLTRRSGCK